MTATKNNYVEAHKNDRTFNLHRFLKPINILEKVLADRFRPSTKLNKLELTEVCVYKYLK
jgi:hypothetical protein